MPLKEVAETKELTYHMDAGRQSSIFDSLQFVSAQFETYLGEPENQGRPLLCLQKPTL